MKYVEREDIDAKLKENLKIKRNTYLLPDLRKKFPSSFETQRIQKGAAIELLRRFLSSRDIKNMMIFVDRGWEHYSRGVEVKGVQFEVAEEAINFINENLKYGADNCYVTMEAMGFFVVISIEEKIEVLGAEGFVKSCKERYLVLE